MLSSTLTSANWPNHPATREFGSRDLFSYFQLSCFLPAAGEIAGSLLSNPPGRRPVLLAVGSSGSTVPRPWRNRRLHLAVELKRYMLAISIPPEVTLIPRGESQLFKPRRPGRQPPLPRKTQSAEAFEVTSPVLAVPQW